MRLCILTQYYPPETGAPQNRLHDLALGLKAAGHDVEVLTAMPNYPLGIIFSGYENRSRLLEFIDGIKVIRVSLYVPKKKTFMKRLLSYLSFAWNVYWQGPKMIQRPDIIFMESPPIFLGISAVRLARKFKAKFVCNISDLWPRSVLELGFIKEGFLYGIAKKLEQWIYKNSDLISGQTEGILRSIREIVPTKPVILFRNGVNVSRFGGVIDREAVRREFDWRPGQIVFGYCGVVGHAQALDQILEAAKLVSNDHLRFIFAFFGDGPLLSSLQDRALTEGIPGVQFYGHRKTNEIPRILTAIDVGLVPLAKAEIFKGARPSKLFEVMAAGKPVLFCGMGETLHILQADDLQSSPFGYICPPEQPKQLAEVIEKIFKERTFLEAKGALAREFVLKNYDRRQIGLEMEAAFSKLLSSKQEATQAFV